jgi:hypothetical protein
LRSTPMGAGSSPPRMTGPSSSGRRRRAGRSSPCSTGRAISSPA